MPRIVSDIALYKNYPHIGADGENKIRLVKDWAVMIEHNGVNKKLRFTAGQHEYDGLTGWRIANRLIKLDPLRSIPAWLMHDDLYITRGLNGDLRLTRKEVDKLFYNCMRKLGFGWIRSEMAYIAVRLIGQEAWDND